MLLASALVPLTCWLCLLVVTPRRSPLGNEVQEQLYTRLLGRQRTLALVAGLATLVAAIAAVATGPQRLDPDLRAVRQARAACIAARDAASDAAEYGVVIQARCYELQPGGTWAEQVEQPDGSWRFVAQHPALPVPASAGISASRSTPGSGTASTTGPISARISMKELDKDASHPFAF
jgi:hypothetical protein